MPGVYIKLSPTLTLWSARLISQDGLIDTVIFAIDLVSTTRLKLVHASFFSEF